MRGNGAAERHLLDAPVAFLIGLNLYLAAIYTNIAVTVGGVVVPGVLGIVGAVFIARQLRNLWWLGWLGFFLTVSLAAGDPEMFGYRLPSWLQMVTALAVAHVLLCNLDHRDAVRKTLAGWLVFITVGVVLEALFPPVREMSDAFRQWVFDGRFVYDNDARDLREYGLVRPKLFTQEPSHIAKAFIVFGTGWYLLSTRRRLVLLLGCTVVLAVFLRSPFVLLALPLSWFLDRLAVGKPVSGVAAAGVPLLGVSAVVSTQLFSTRFATIRSGADFSFFSRYQGPFQVAAETLDQHPFGVGIGAKEALWEPMRTAYSPFYESGSYLHTLYLNYFNNAFANSLMFFGAAAVVFYLLVALWAKSFGVRASAALVVVLLFFQLDGALEGVRMWSSIALLWGCYMLRSHASPSPTSVSPPRRTPASIPRQPTW